MHMAHARLLELVRLIKHYGLNIEGLNAVVVGRSPILGKPMAMMLLNLNATVTICHSRTQNIETIINKCRPNCWSSRNT